MIAPINKPKPIKPCPKCGGKGEIELPLPVKYPDKERTIVVQVCTACNGSGLLGEE